MSKRYLVHSIFGPTGETETDWIVADSEREAVDFVERQGNYNPYVVDSQIIGKPFKPKKAVTKKITFSKKVTSSNYQWKQNAFAKSTGSGAKLANYKLTVYSFTGKKDFFFTTEKAARNFQSIVKTKRNHRKSFVNKIYKN